MAIIVTYSVLFLSFFSYYMTRGDDVIGREWHDGFKEALAYCMETSPECIIHVREIPYSLVLFYSRYPTDRFVATVDFSETNPRFRTPTSFEGFRYDGWDQIVPGDIYICKEDSDDAFKLDELDVVRKEFGQYAVYVITE